jgi:DNA-binding XRE family transcriptional regulator
LSSGASIKNLAAKFGRFIREARETKGHLQANIAEKLGISRSYYGHIESGNREIYFTLAINICRVPDPDINDFMKLLKYPPIVRL